MTIPRYGVLVLYWTGENSFNLDCEVSVPFHMANIAEEKYSPFRKAVLCQFISHSATVPSVRCSVYSKLN